MFKDRWHGTIFIIVGTFLAMVLSITILGAHSKDGNKSAKSSYKVMITREGFSPSNLHIPRGASVTWVNEDTLPHWPASNAHPTHTLYPQQSREDCLGSAFDACRGLAQKGALTFTFTERGVWGYHDHLFPSRVGTVTVISTTTEASLRNTLAQYVRNAWNRLSSLFASRPELPAAEQLRSAPFPEQVKIVDTYSRSDSIKAWEYLKNGFIENGEVVGNAHALAHIVGNNAYRTHGLSGIQICDFSFAYGCLHGVTEQLLVSEGPDVMGNMTKRCREVFPESDQNTSIGYTGCIHGLGHGLLSWNSLDVGTALFYCDKLNKRDRPYCYDGVFMEYSFSAPDSAFDDERPWQLCSSLDTSYQYNCARYMPTVFRDKFNLDIATLATFCNEAPTTGMARACVYNIGYHVAQIHHSSPEGIKEQCSQTTTPDTSYSCITAAAGELIFQGYKDWRSNARALCNSLPRKFKELCHERNGQIAQQYNRSYTLP